jgi:uroporphyrinogen decarboxylase
MSSIINTAFLDACNNKKPTRIPVWFMRQAGRYQPEYRKIREKYSLLDICSHPEVCAEVTLLPVAQLDVDAGILFSDIMVPLAPMGVDFDIVENKGPVIANPIESVRDIENLKSIDAEETLPHVAKSIELIVAELTVPLIGFCGAPYTLASYMIEGGPSKNYTKTKALMFNEPKGWHLLMEKLSMQMADYLRFQVEHGCTAVQIFDSWVGSLNLADYQEYVFPHMKNLFDRIKDLEVPKIHFGVINGHLLEAMQDCGATVVGIDWRMDIKEARRRLNSSIAIQGNLDPSLLIANDELVEKKTKEILDSVNFDNFIFNLGHGIMPQANPETLRFITEIVHNSKKN